MSHWVTCKNDILKKTNIKHLESALRDLGLELKDDVKEIQNSYGRDKVDMALAKKGNVLPLGFKKIDDDLELRGDFFATGLNSNTFLNEVAQHYEKHRIKNVLALAGWTVRPEKINAEGEIEIEAIEYVG